MPSHQGRARSSAIYLVVMQGSFAIGALVWGRLTSHFGAPIALAMAAAGLLLSAILSRHLPISHVEQLDLSPSGHWPDHALVNEPAPDDGPVLVTTSVHDRAVRTFYPLAAAARSQVSFAPGELPGYGGIGTFGVRGPGIELVDGDLRPLTEPYELRPHVVYNLRADHVIAAGRGLMGAHSDIARPEVAHALWQTVLAGRG